MKFKDLHTAFKFFDMGRKSYLSLGDWKRGLKEIGQDCILDAEVESTFEFLDRSKAGKVSFEDFKDLLFY